MHPYHHDVLADVFDVIENHHLGSRIHLRCTVQSVARHLQNNWIVQGICGSFGASARVRYRCIAPPVRNDPALTALLERSAVEQLGAGQVQRLEQPSLGAEDFAELLQDVPGTMFRLGVAGPDGCAPLHNGFFNPEEQALGVGVQVLTAAMLAWTPTP